MAGAIDATLRKFHASLNVFDLEHQSSERMRDVSVKALLPVTPRG